MRHRRRATIEELRLTIASLPRATRIAMLEGIDHNPIIVGAYSSEDGICPMLAAHRAGGRTTCISFARAWDRFAFRGARSRSARRATRRELLVLKSHLEASLLEDGGPLPALASVAAEHMKLTTRSLDRSSRTHRPGDPDRSKELGDHPGWAWTQVVRRYDDYRRTVTTVPEWHADDMRVREYEYSS